MGKEIEMVYENGVFRPLAPVDLKEGQKLKVYYRLAPPDPPPGETLEEKLRRLGAGIFADIPDDEWEVMQQALKRT